MKAKLLPFLICVLFFYDIKAQFSPMRPLSGGSDHFSDFELGDIDGDGDEDIVSISSETRFIGWIENLGDGKYSTQHYIYRNYFGPDDLALGDLNNDGNLDIVLGSGHGLLVFINRGNGRFETVRFIPASSPDDISGQHSVKIADIDNDGDNDIIVHEETFEENFIYIMKNDGNGHFFESNILFATDYGGAEIASIHSVDLDEDGDIDILVSMHDFGFTSSLLLFENIGDGEFLQSIIKETESNLSDDISICDYDSDSDLDIIYLNIERSAFGLLRNVDGEFINESIAGEILDEAVGSYTVFHINDDTIMDIAVHIKAFGFAPDKVKWFNLEGDTLVETHVLSGVHSAFFDSNYPQTIRKVDLNNDGFEDLVFLSDFRDGIVASYNTGDGEFENDIIIEPNGYDERILHSDDITGNGTKDIIVGQINEANDLMLNKGIGENSFEQASTISSSFDASYFNSIQPFDPDGDGDLDILYSEYYSGTIGWLENIGEGVFGDDHFIDESADWVGTVLSTDLNDDGLDDILVSYRFFGNIFWYPKIEDGVYGEPIEIVSELSGVSSLQVADFDLDGLPDIAASGLSNDSIVWYRNLGGDFASLSVISTEHSETEKIIAIDLDSDLDKDIVGINLEDGTEYLFWIENNGDGSFSPTSIIDTYIPQLSDFDVGDIDGDGDLDIAITQELYGFTIANYEVSWYRNQGDNLFSKKIKAANIWDQAYDIRLDDLDMDGDLDIIAGTGNAPLWLENLSLNLDQVRGQIFFDANMNGIKDTNEIGIPNLRILSTPMTVPGVSQNDGEFQVNISNFIESYVIYPQEMEFWEIVSDSLSYHISVDEDFSFQEGLDFGIYPDTIANKVKALITGGFPGCNDTINCQLSIRNTGTTLPSGNIHLLLNDEIEYISSVVAPDSVVGQNIYWHYDSLGYFLDSIINVRVMMPSEEHEGELLTSFLNVTVLGEIGDTLFTDMDSMVNELICVENKNWKIVQPSGIDSLGFIPPETDVLEYTIYFQNTYSDTAQNILVSDCLDPKIDWSSFQLISSSHPVDIEIFPSGKVAFYFSEINLPMSEVNAFGSQGFVKYKVNLGEEALPGSTIYNHALIEFDRFDKYTNITRNTLYDCNQLLEQILIDPTFCYEDTINARIESVPSTAIFDWVIEGFDAYLDTTECSWVIDSVGVFDMEVSVMTDFCFADTVINFEVLAPPYEIIDTLYLCESDSILIYDEYRHEPGIYSDTIASIESCDSILAYQVLSKPTFGAYDTLYKCPSDSLLIYGTYRIDEGSYYDSLVTIFGCDSIFSTFLLNYETFILYDESVHICLGDSALIYGEYHSEPGLYYDHFVSIEGCDSSHVKELIVEDLTLVSFLTDLIEDTMCIYTSEIILSADPSGGIFSGPGISGESFIPSEAGLGLHSIYYFYEDEFGCTGSDSIKIFVDDCLGLIENSSGQISIYPNPVNGQVNIDLGDLQNVSIRVYAVSGQVLYQADNVAAKIHSFELDVDAGIYVVEVSAEGVQEYFRLVVE